MNKDIKLLIGALAFTLLLIIGFALLIGKSGKPADTIITNTEVLGLSASPEAYDLGDVPINGGKVYKEYEVRNATGNIVKLKKIATSCMCTQAKVIVGDKETKYFGMEGHGDKNAPVNLELKPNDVAKVNVEFDPAAHGPQGTGAFERVIWLTFSDPAGVKELMFNGTVVN